jgi:hypothetical protein
LIVLAVAIAGSASLAWLFAAQSSRSPSLASSSSFYNFSCSGAGAAACTDVVALFTCWGPGALLACFT